MKFTKNQIDDLLHAICNNAVKKDGTYLLPCLYLKGIEPKVLDQELKAIGDQIIPLFLYNTEKDSSNNFFKSLKEMLGELLFDGKGFFVPCFGVYVNKAPKNQKYNAQKADPSGAMIDYYDFMKDTAFESFIMDLANNIKDFEGWIKKRAKMIQSPVEDYTEQLNTDFKGIQEMHQPYLKLIDEHQKKMK